MEGGITETAVFDKSILIRFNPTTPPATKMEDLQHVIKASS